MLVLDSIVKTYLTGDNRVQALNGVSLAFRRNEFVSVLGQSGCGKTTLLNIVGGLDQYTSGDLIINGRSTKKYKDADWDTYRNHSIGFVFQNYNLIPHQSVLANVELALTLSGVSKAERRRRAVEALTKVGLGDQLHKRPNQMSGGQMQRVAIARALINNPEILLADEPTGALDSETSVQVMELLKEIATDRLVIMVTHNPELAEEYSTRIIRLLDGRVVDDTNPYSVEEEAAERPEEPAPTGKRKKKAAKKTSMSYRTAISLSLNNLLTKKTRTILTSFAGSIGIIGIALILSLSSGVQAYIDRTESETLTNYPLTIDRQSVDYTAMLMQFADRDETPVEEGKVPTQKYLFNQLHSVSASTKANDLKAFRTYLLEHKEELAEYTEDIRYKYNTTIYAYNTDNPTNPVQVNPNHLSEEIGMADYMAGQLDSTAGMFANTMDSNLFTEMLENEKLRENYYDLVAGEMPKTHDEVLLLLDKDGRISDYSLYSLGILDRAELKAMMKDMPEKMDYPVFAYEDLLGRTFRVLATADLYQKDPAGRYVNLGEDPRLLQSVLADALEVKIVGVAKVSEDASTMASYIGGMVGYLPSLSRHIMERNNESDIVKAQMADPKVDIFTGAPFKTQEEIEAEIQNFDISMVDPMYQPLFADLEGEELARAIRSYVLMMHPSTTYADNLVTLGVGSLDDPATIEIYCKDFEAKEWVTDFIDNYNKTHGQEQSIQYTDYIGLMMSSVTTIVNAISYVLIAFVGISLVVSSIMIGIITYISVLERTKEIGILRAIGASKRDISRVFNAETLIVGFVAGLIGILLTVLLCIPTNAIIHALSGISDMRAALPPMAGVILVAISMGLTVIAGLLPSRVAAKRDPVEALRSE